MHVLSICWESVCLDSAWYIHCTSNDASHSGLFQWSISGYFRYNSCLLWLALCPIWERLQTYSRSRCSSQQRPRQLQARQISYHKALALTLFFCRNSRGNTRRTSQETQELWDVWEPRVSVPSVLCHHLHRQPLRLTPFMRAQISTAASPEPDSRSSTWIFSESAWSLLRSASEMPKWTRHL